MADEMERELTEAITAVLRRHDRGMATKWVILCEVMAETGARALWLISDDEATPWDTVGLLAHAMHVCAAKTARTTPDDT